MERYEIQKLRELPIEAVAERLGLRVKKHHSVCCFHDDHNPSLYFNVKKNTFRCFSCGAHGGVIDLALKLLPSTGRSGEGSFVEACQWLANENNIILTEYKPQTEKLRSEPQIDLVHLSRLVCQPYLNDEARRFLFDERHIHPAVAKWLGLSSISAPVPMSSSMQGPWFNAPSLLIPYRDIDGNLINVQARYLGVKRTVGERAKPPRFQFPRGAHCHIFNLPVLKMLREGEDLWIAEGCSDCMALLSSGKKAIAIPSATLLKHDDMRLLSTSLSSSSKLHIYPDQDQAGENLYNDLVRVATEIKRCLVRHDLPEGCKDFGDYWKSQFNNPQLC